MNYKNRLLIVALTCFLFSCKTDLSEPQRILDQIIKADNESDIKKIMSLYAEDAFLLPPGRPDITGKEAIQKNYENIFAQSKLQLSSTTNEMLLDGNIAVIIGNTTGKTISLSDSSITPVNDKFVMILRKVEQEHKLKIHSLMWSKNE